MRWNVRQRDESRRNTIIELETHFGVRGACVRSRVVQFIASSWDLMFICVFYYWRVVMTLWFDALTKFWSHLFGCEFARAICVSNAKYLTPEYLFHAMTMFYCVCKQSPVSRSACGHANFPCIVQTNCSHFLFLFLPVNDYLWKQLNRLIIETICIFKL